MAQQQWYMAIGGHQVGPVSQDDVITNLRNGTIDGNTLVFTAGMKNWTPLKDVPELATFLAGGSATRVGAVPPPIAGRTAHEIDFRILGSEMQFVEVELDPGESAVAEAGSMMYMTPGIQMETIFGDGALTRIQFHLDELHLAADDTEVDIVRPLSGNDRWWRRRGLSRRGPREI